MQVNMLEAKTQLSKLVEAVLRGEEVIIANRGKPVVKLIKAQAPPVKRVAGAWEGLMTEEEIDHAFSPEVEAEMAREWIESMARPIDAGVKPKRREKAAVPAHKTKRAATARRAR
jgi:prevent-host-death family protein